jgi:diadenosine tetraphosphatase ApaH/serine/threonine PP2A family protein phosphatase
VGRSKDGDWRACYGVLDVTEGELGVQFVRVEYDLEAAMQGIRSSGLPDEFAEHLRSGGMAG